MTTESSALRVSLWTVSRWWHGPGALTVSAVCGVASLVLAGWTWQAAAEARATRAGLESQLVALRHEQPAVLPLVNTSTADFTAHLPATVAPAIALNVVQGAATRAAVMVEAVQVQEYAPSPERLGRTELAMTVRGSYANLKRWLAELTARLPASTVSRLQLQRSADAAADIEARLTLVAWSQPAVAAEPR
jgi:Type II secretion system (T2SS), protein M subtype b